jgi:hypothetical protein
MPITPLSRARTAASSGLPAPVGTSAIARLFLPAMFTPFAGDPARSFFAPG